MHTLHDADGRPLLVVMCPDDELGIYISRHSAAGSLPGNHLDKMVVAGQATPIPPRPPEVDDWVFSYAQGGAWLDPLTPVERCHANRAKKWEQIKAARDAEARSPTLVVYGRAWQVDDASRAAMRCQLDVADAVGTSWTTVWTFADNSRDTVSAPGLRSVLMAFGLRADAAHQRAQALRARIDAAMSVAEINSINWETE